MEMVISAALVLIAGVAAAIEAPTNAVLHQNVSSFALTAFLTMAIGAIGAGIVLVAVRPHPQAAWATTTPWYAFTGGLYAAMIVAIGAYATPKLGAGPTMVLTVAAQACTGVLLDNMGALGLEKHPAGILRIAGCLVAIGGAVMISLG